MSGRYPYHLRATRCNLIPASVPEGLHLDYELLPKTLAKAGYVSHHVGKWHMGFHTAEYTPVGRGFNTSWGFLEGGEDHYTERCGAGQVTCDGPGGRKSSQYPDLWAQNVDGAGFPGKPLHSRVGNVSASKPGLDSTYTAMMFTARVVDIVKDAGAAVRAAESAVERQRGGATAAAPFFVYWALHNTHAPIEAPARFVSMYDTGDVKKDTFLAMVSVVDETVKNVTDALKAEGMWDNTLLVWSTDNGSPVQVCYYIFQSIFSVHSVYIQCEGFAKLTFYLWVPPVQVAGSNHPLRGGKSTNWEGGVRVPTFVSGGALPVAMRGASLDGLVHVSDW